MPRSTAKKDARTKLLDAALAVIRAKGYAATSVDELCAAAGVTKGAFFHHFKTKEDILYAVMEEAIHYNFARMEAAVAAGRTPREQLRGLIRAELESINGDTGDAMSVLVYEWNALSPASQKPLLEMRARYEALWEGVLAAARGQGLLRHDPFIWRRLVSGAISWTRMWYKRNGPVSLDALAEMTLEMALGAE